MENDLEKEPINFEEFIKKIENFELPTYKDLPEIPLYMEQVVGYINESLGALSETKDINITPFMINNYVKAKIIDAPKEKKYNKTHLGYLIAISLLKIVVSMKNLALFIDIDRYDLLKVSQNDVKTLYDTFKLMEEEALKNVIHKVKTRYDVLKKGNKKNKVENEIELENINLAYIALKLYIEAEANKLIADMIMERVSLDLLPKELKEKLDTSKYDRKKSVVEAKKLRDRQKGVKK